MVIDVETYEAGWSRTISQLDGANTHQHSGSITDIVPGTHHRLTVRVHDGDDREYSGSLDITRDDFEVMATDLGPRDSPAGRLS
jgi:hypothetical protein